MNFKICTKCKNKKSVSEFNKDKQHKDGLNSRCKDCIKEYQKQYRLTHKDKAQEYRKMYCTKHKDKLRNSQRKWREKSNEYMKKYRLDNKERILNCSKEYYIKNKSKILENRKTYRLQNADKIKNYQNQYEKSNRENIRKRRRKYIKIKFKNDISFKIAHNIRNRINKALKLNRKSISTMKLIGCSFEELKIHIEKQFSKGMSWDNYGLYGWHIDHIIPCASFDLTDIEQQKKCFHYTNLQPLWAIDNLKKSNIY